MTTTKTLPQEVQEWIKDKETPFNGDYDIECKYILEDLAHWYEERLEKAVEAGKKEVAIECMDLLPESLREWGKKLIEQNYHSSN